MQKSRHVSILRSQLWLADNMGLWGEGGPTQQASQLFQESGKTTL